mmetsp:Transcript_28763/g.66335  ORF Transcript_28763/g.66335 Transcript_28763/m.66335 type:complete len:553 (-) Transcript_28763:267-1925(-)
MLGRTEAIEFKGQGTGYWLCQRLTMLVSWKHVKMYRFACLFAILGAALAGGLKAWQVYNDEGDKVLTWLLLFEPEAYTSFTFLLGFMVAFRTNQAYQRHWEGVTLLQNMMGNWHDAASSLIAFCRHSSATTRDIMDFQHVLVRLLSLMNALVFCELSGHDGDSITSTDHLQYKLLDIAGLDHQTLRSIVDSDCRPELAFQKVQALIVNAVKKGVLTIPPPLLTRSFQEMSNAMLNFHEASKLASVPFPGAYSAATHILTAVHIFMTPMVVVFWSRTVTWCAVFSFVLIFIMCSLLTLAEGLDNPFDPNTSELDLLGAQILFNNRLACLMRECDSEVPVLSRDALLEPIKRPSPMPHNTPRATIATARSLRDLFNCVQGRNGSMDSMTRIGSLAISSRKRLNSDTSFDVASTADSEHMRGSDYHRGSQLSEIKDSVAGELDTWSPRRDNNYVVRARPARRLMPEGLHGAAILPVSPVRPDGGESEGSRSPVASRETQDHRVEGDACIAQEGWQPQRSSDTVQVQSVDSPIGAAEKIGQESGCSPCKACKPFAV